MKVKITNLKKLTCTVSGIEIPPLGTVSVEKSVWEKLWKLKEVRESVNLGYLMKTEETHYEPKKKEVK